jgi:hypothetical protein
MDILDSANVTPTLTDMIRLICATKDVELRQIAPNNLQKFGI